MGHGNFKSVCLSIIALTLALPGFAEQTASPKEALILRRITEYWRDGDYASAKRQILDFLEKNPQTTLRDPLCAMLGDLYFQERDYRQALATYDQIINSEIRQKTFFNNLQAHFEMKDYGWVIEKSENHLKLNKDGDKQLEMKVRYLFAEAAFREALLCKEMDQRLAFLKVAKPQFKILTQSQYGDRALFPLAEIHRLLKEDDRAAALYLQLAQKYPVHRERFLFQAAILQINQDKEEAIRAFEQVYQMGGKRAKLAAFNELILLYQNQQYEEYINFFSKVVDLIPNEKIPLLQFYEGRSFYSLGDFEQAVTALEAFVESQPMRCKELKAALLLLVNCSRQLKDGQLLERTLYSFKNQFPKDPELAKIVFTHSQICRENGNFAGALQDLKLLMSDFPLFEENELVLYDMGLILEQTDQLQEARETFLTFIEKYPESQRQHAAWRHLINCSIEELKNPEQAHSAESKESFVRILDSALKKKDLLNEKEQKQYALVQIKFLCDLSKYDEAIPLLSQFLADNVEEDYLAEAHLLMALCQQKSGQSSGLFIAHGEKALSMRPYLPQSDILHLELYNAYLSLAQSEQEESTKTRLLSKAADHLFESGNWKNGAIKRDNLIWLTHHYFERAKISTSDLEHASKLFNSLLSTDEGMSQLVIPPESIELEAQALKYAYLLGVHQRTHEQIALLEALVRKQETQTELPWKLKRRSILELAKAYESNGQYENAVRSYQFLSSCGSAATSLVTATAQLHLARLQYQLLPMDKKHTDHPDVIGVLHRLKDLQIQKRLPAEPIHLEAALEYAELRGELADLDDQASSSLFFLQRMQEDFTTNGDLVSLEYNSLRQRFPEKDQIYHAYMTYVEAQCLKWKAEIAREEGDPDRAVECEEQALALLDQLLETEEALKPYLIERVKQSRAKIAK